jgi:TolA C-terminal
MSQLRWALCGLVCLAACEKRSRDPEPAPVRINAPARLPVVLDAAVALPPVDAGAPDDMAVDLPLRGARDRTTIGETLRRASGRMKRCFQTQLKTNPNLGGKVTLHMTIVPDGTVPEVTATGGLDAGLQQCMIAVAERLRFPPDPGTTHVNFPFIFQISP